MGNQIPEDPYRAIARERSHEEAKQTVATNGMLVPKPFINQWWRGYRGAGLAAQVVQRL
jgi:hypothetical protein